MAARQLWWAQTIISINQFISEKAGYQRDKSPSSWSHMIIYTLFYHKQKHNKWCAVAAQIRWRVPNSNDGQKLIKKLPTKSLTKCFSYTNSLTKKLV